MSCAFAFRASIGTFVSLFVLGCANTHALVAPRASENRPSFGDETSHLIARRLGITMGVPGAGWDLGADTERIAAAMHPSGAILVAKRWSHASLVTAERCKLDLPSSRKAQTAEHTVAESTDITSDGAERRIRASLDDALNADLRRVGRLRIVLARVRECAFLEIVVTHKNLEAVLEDLAHLETVVGPSFRTLTLEERAKLAGTVELRSH